MKKLDVFGVKMTSLQEMKFSKYLENNRIAMNTFYKEQRTEIAKKWLNDYEDYYHQEQMERDNEEKYNECSCGAYCIDGTQVADCIC